MADRAFDLFITDADLIDVIGEIEGKAWVALQRIDELSPTTVTANLDAFNVLRDMGAQALRLLDAQALAEEASSDCPARTASRLLATSCIQTAASRSR